MAIIRPQRQTNPFDWLGLILLALGAGLFVVAAWIFCGILAIVRWLTGWPAPPGLCSSRQAFKHPAREPSA